MLKQNKNGDVISLIAKGSLFLQIAPGQEWNFLFFSSFTSGCRICCQQKRKRNALTKQTPGTLLGGIPFCEVMLNLLHKEENLFFFYYYHFYKRRILDLIKEPSRKCPMQMWKEKVKKKKVILLLVMSKEL